MVVIMLRAESHFIHRNVMINAFKFSALSNKVSVCSRGMCNLKILTIYY